MKIKNRIITRYYFVAINTFRYMIWCDLNIFHLFLRNFANFRNTTTVKKAPRNIHVIDRSTAEIRMCVDV